MYHIEISGRTHVRNHKILTYLDYKRSRKLQNSSNFCTSENNNWLFIPFLAFVNWYITLDFYNEEMVISGSMDYSVKYYYAD